MLTLLLGAKGVEFLESCGVEKWSTYPYDRRGGGCGGSVSLLSTILILWTR